MNAIDVRNASIASLRAYANSPTGQETINGFIEHLRNDVGHREGYEFSCRKAESETASFNEANFREFVLRLEPYLKELPPGHDSGHIYRDFLGSAALFCADPNINKAKYKSDAIAGLFGFAHDVGNALVRRYADKSMVVGHAEVGAWVVYNLMSDLFGPHLAMLASYGIAAHMHLPKDLVTPSGFIRKPYWAELFENGGIVGYAAKIIARGGDRLDTGGGVSQLIRHLLATSDAIEQGGESFDIKGGSQMEYFVLNREALITALEIKVRPKDARAGAVTLLEHLDGFGYTQIQDPPSIYNQDDPKVPLLQSLIKERVRRFGILKESMLRMMQSSLPEESGTPPPQDPWLEFKSFARQVSHADPWKLDTTFQILERAWQELDTHTQLVWGASVPLMRKLYLEETRKNAEIIQQSGSFLSGTSEDIFKRVI